MPEHKAQPNPNPPDGAAIEVEGLSFAWPGRSAFRLEVPSFRLQRGERLFLFGQSGSGKSTLLGLICGILEAQAGQLSVLDTDLAKLSRPARDRFRAEQIGVIFQMFNLLPYASPRDNILLPLNFAPERRRRTGPEPEAEAGRLAELMGLPHHLLTRRTSADLSVGQQQRVAAARALIGQPPLIIADEPTSALDKSAEDQFIDLLFSQLEGTGSSLIMVSHDMRLSERFDRTLHLADLAQTSREGDA